MGRTEAVARNRVLTGAFRGQLLGSTLQEGQLCSFSEYSDTDRSLETRAGDKLDGLWMRDGPDEIMESILNEIVDRGGGGEAGGGICLMI